MTKTFVGFCLSMTLLYSQALYERQKRSKLDQQLSGSETQKLLDFHHSSSSVPVYLQNGRRLPQLDHAQLLYHRPFENGPPTVTSLRPPGHVTGRKSTNTIYGGTPTQGAVDRNNVKPPGPSAKHAGTSRDYCRTRRPDSKAAAKYDQMSINE